MANPRKFSEKIALHNQKQAEETAAFEAIMREVTATTRVQPPTIQPQQPSQHLTQPQLGVYRGGSLPNVNQPAIDLQGALNNLEDMKQATGRQSLIDRYQRQRQVQTHRRQFPFDKRADCSPYGSAYLSPPPDSSWRRTNSDSALHTSAMGQMAGIAGENSVQTDNLNIYQPQQGHSRPKSCEVPGINIYPSPEQGQSIPISNNTGSLPDLTNIQFPSPLATPLDSEEQQQHLYHHHQQQQQQQQHQAQHQAILSPSQPHHHIGPVRSSQQGSTSPASRRRQSQGSPSGGGGGGVVGNGPPPLNIMQGSPTQMRHSMSPQGSSLEVNVGQLSIDNRTHTGYHPYSGGGHHHHHHHHHSPHGSHHQQQHHSPQGGHTNRQSSPSRLRVPLPQQLQNLVTTSANQNLVTTADSGGVGLNNPTTAATALAMQSNHLTANHQSTVNNNGSSSSSHLLDLVNMAEHNNGNMLPSNCINRSNQQQQQQQQTQPNRTLSHPKIVISSIENDGTSVNCENSRNSMSTSQELNNGDNSLCSKGAQNQQGSPLSYRNSQSECPPSPNSPVSPHSFSPSQSPGLPQTNSPHSNSVFTENNYYNSQQQQQVALQHKFEQFNMIQDNPVVTTLYNMIGNCHNNPAISNNVHMDSNQDYMHAVAVAAAAAQHNNHNAVQGGFYTNSVPQQGVGGGVNGGGGAGSTTHSPHHSPHPPGSPQLNPPSPQSPAGQTNTSPTQLTPQELYHNVSPAMSPQNQQNSIPDIIFTGADDLLAKQDLVKDMSNAIANIQDFDADFFQTDEELKMGLDPLDLEGIQMLTDPNLVTDSATEDSFRLDRL